MKLSIEAMNSLDFLGDYFEGSSLFYELHEHRKIASKRRYNTIALLLFVEVFIILVDAREINENICKYSTSSPLLWRAFCWSSSSSQCRCNYLL